MNKFKKSLNYAEGSYSGCNADNIFISSLNGAKYGGGFRFLAPVVALLIILSIKTRGLKRGFNLNNLPQ
jgi:hypothetical protein